MSDSDESLNDYKKYTKGTVNTKQLIQLVQARPCLWDRSEESYRDRGAKDRAWREIYKELVPDYDELNSTKKNQVGQIITRKWYNVRDAYVKSRKPSSAHSRPYLYSSMMTFLDPIYVNQNHTYSSRKSIGNKSYKIQKTEECMSNDEEEEASEWMNEVFVDIDDEENQEENEEDHLAKRAKVEFVQTKEEAEESVVTVLANLIQKEEDEDRAFFKSITPAVKTLSESSKFEFRIEVMKLIKRLKKRDKKILRMKSEGISNNSDSE